MHDQLCAAQELSVPVRSGGSRAGTSGKTFSGAGVFKAFMKSANHTWMERLSSFLPCRIRRRVDTGYCDRLETDLDRALRLVEEARETGRSLSVGLVGNIAEVFCHDGQDEVEGIASGLSPWSILDAFDQSIGAR